MDLSYTLVNCMMMVVNPLFEFTFILAIKEQKLQELR